MKNASTEPQRTMILLSQVSLKEHPAIEVRISMRTGSYSI
jgi:hypothetical protein